MVFNIHNILIQHINFYTNEIYFNIIHDILIEHIIHSAHMAYLLCTYSPFQIMSSLCYAISFDMCLYLILSIPNVKMYHTYFVAKPYIKFYIQLSLYILLLFLVHMLKQFLFV